MKINNIIGIFLLISIILFIFPIKTTSSSISNITNQEKLNLFKNDIINQEFVSSVDNLKSIQLNFYEMVSSNSIVQIKVTNPEKKVIYNKKIHLANLNESKEISINFDTQKNVKNKVFTIDMIIENSDNLGISFVTGTTHLDKLMVNNKKLKKSLSIVQFGRKRNYVYIWYLLIFSSILYTFDSIIMEKRKEK